MGQHSGQQQKKSRRSSRRGTRAKKDPFLKLEVSSLSSLATSLDRPLTREMSGLLSREQTFLTCRPGTSNYLDRCNELAFTPEAALLLPRPGTSYVPKAVESVLNESYCKELTESQTRPSTSYLASKPNQLLGDPMEELHPVDILVTQRKYSVLPSIGKMSDLFLSRRQQRPFNQLDIDRGQFESDATFFAAEFSSPDSAAAKVTRMTPVPLPPIQRLDWNHCRQTGLISECEEEQEQQEGEDEYFESWSEQASDCSSEGDSAEGEDYTNEVSESGSELEGSEYEHPCSPPPQGLFSPGVGELGAPATQQHAMGRRLSGTTSSPISPPPVVSPGSADRGRGATRH